MWRLLQSCCCCWWISSLILPAFVLLWAECHPGKFHTPYHKSHTARYLGAALGYCCGIAFTKRRSNRLSDTREARDLYATDWPIRTSSVLKPGVIPGALFPTTFFHLVELCCPSLTGQPLKNETRGKIGLRWHGRSSIQGRLLVGLDGYIEKGTHNDLSAWVPKPKPLSHSLKQDSRAVKPPRTPRLATQKTVVCLKSLLWGKQTACLFLGLTCRLPRGCTNNKLWL